MFSLQKEWEKISEGKDRAANTMFYFLCEGLPQTSHDLFEAAPTYLRYKFGLLTLQSLKNCFKPLINDDEFQINLC